MKYFLFALSCFALNAFAEDNKTRGTLIDFSAQAQRSAPNDLGNATLYFEADGEKPGELARRVNQVIANALATAKSATEVKVKTGSSNTYPIYAKNSRSIESWRIHAGHRRFVLQPRARHAAKNRRRHSDGCARDLPRKSCPLCRCVGQALPYRQHEYWQQRRVARIQPWCPRSALPLARASKNRPASDRDAALQ